MAQEAVTDWQEAEPIFFRTSALWSRALRDAQAMPRSSFPSASFDLRSLLARVPEFPDTIASDAVIVQGRSRWRNRDSGCPIQERTEAPLTISIRSSHPVTCFLYSDSFLVWEGTPNNGVALLVFAWAYIMNARLAASQNLLLESRGTASTMATPTSHDGYGTVNLNYATKEELGWWQLITTPGIYFAAQNNEECLPWSISPDKHGGLRFIPNDSHQEVQIDKLPSASQAAVYVHRLCHVYGLQNQCSAALAAAISLPSQRKFSPCHSQVLLPRPKLLSQLNPLVVSEDLPPGFDTLGYYMTLSTCRRVYSSCLESVLWKPNVACNAAGAVLRSIYNLLHPIIESRDFELISKVLACSKAAPLWLGMALCSKVSSISTVLQHGACSRGQAETAAWTGIPQSFMDIPPCSPFLKDGVVSRANIWRLRHEFHHQYPNDEDYSGYPTTG